MRKDISSQFDFYATFLERDGALQEHSRVPLLAQMILLFHAPARGGAQADGYEMWDSPKGVVIHLNGHQRDEGSTK